MTKSLASSPSLGLSPSDPQLASPSPNLPHPGRDMLEPVPWGGAQLSPLPAARPLVCHSWCQAEAKARDTR
jgi:hypothetical protein